MTLLSAAPDVHIYLDPDGIAWIDDTRVKVIEVVLDKLAHQSSPEEMQRQLPHLSLAQIHAALSYYYDHQGELDGQMEERRRYAEDLARQAGESPFRKRLRETGRLP
jgi:uncharacterized protein (DUF433 family)